MAISLDGNGPAALQISTHRDDRGLLLRLGGELDMATAGHLVDLAATLPTQDVGHVCCDLSGLEFIDAAGLGALCKVHVLVNSRGGRFSVTGPRPLARRLLGITGLDGLLEIDADVRPGRTDHDARIPRPSHG
jgi:anti-sigma B factor antagonist